MELRLVNKREEKANQEIKSITTVFAKKTIIVDADSATEAEIIALEKENHFSEFMKQYDFQWISLKVNATEDTAEGEYTVGCKLKIKAINNDELDDYKLFLAGYDYHLESEKKTIFAY